jgi:hypothetical protein
MILMRANPFLRPLERGGPENLDFLGPKWHSLRSWPFQCPKKSRFSVPTPSNGSRNGCCQHPDDLSETANSFREKRSILDCKLFAHFYYPEVLYRLASNGNSRFFSSNLSELAQFTF